MRIDWNDVANLMPDAPRVPVAELVLLAEYKKEERVEACGGVDPLHILVAYTQEAWGYDEFNRLVMDNAHPVNVLGKAYKPDAELYVHSVLANICVAAAIDMYHEHGWKMIAFDALRTMEGHHKLYELTPQHIIDSGMLSKPGRSAHNRAMAIDWMAFDAASGEEIPMGGHFDCPDMKLVHRTNTEISPIWIKNRRLREIAIQRAALSLGTIIAPLREEFWDDRMLGSEADFWRAIESIARCLDVPAPAEKAKDYVIFKAQFEAFDPHTIEQVFGEAYETPKLEHIVFHEQFRPIYSAELPAALQQV